MELYGYLAALLIGVSLGVMGSGGSTLTVPVLVYLFGLRPLQATSFSLFIVGVTAAAGAGVFARKGMLRPKTALIFAVPSLAAVLIMRRLLLPMVPSFIFGVGKDGMVMVLFALLMLASSLKMILPAKTSEPDDEVHPIRLALQGLLTGFLTGAVGAGGGFLIIPALVLFAKIPMKEAVGTSLLIIASNSLIGFGSDLIGGMSLNWTLLLTVLGAALVGMVAGFELHRKVSAQHLRPAFGWFVACMGVFVLANQIFAR